LLIWYIILKLLHETVDNTALLFSLHFIALHCSFLGDAFITASTVIPGNSPGVTDPVKQSDAGLIAGATIVATIFMLIAALVVYMCCCRCKQKDASDCFTGSVTPGEFPGMTVLAVMKVSPRKEQWRAMISW
jgi:hypothetical protein